VVVTNASQRDERLVTLTVLSANAPAITGQPRSATNYVGQNVLFNVTATGTAPLSYQWWKDGSPIAGATTASLYLRGFRRQTTATTTSS